MVIGGLTLGSGLEIPVSIVHYIICCMYVYIYIYICIDVCPPLSLCMAIYLQFAICCIYHATYLTLYYYNLRGRHRWTPRLSELRSMAVVGNFAFVTMTQGP